MEKMVMTFTREMESYEREYNAEYATPELERQHQAIIEEAATSYVHGIYVATLWGFGVEAAERISEIAEGYEFVKGQVITGRTTF